MKEYEIEIIETLSRIYKVRASNIDDACQHVKSLYGDSKIVLTAADFAGTEFKVKNVKP